MHAGGKHKKQNRLWLARKHRGLKQKQVAYILNHQTIDQVSRYEKGIRMPTLETALMLEIIYRVPLRLLFKDLYEELQEKVRSRTEDRPSLQHLAKDATAKEEEDSREFCTYEDILNITLASQADLLRVRGHITKLAKKIAHR